MKTFVACICLLFINLAVWGATKIPINKTGDWSDPNNWSPKGVPANGDAVIIPDGYTVSVKKGVYKTAPDLEITVNGTLTFEPSGKLALAVNSSIKLTSTTSKLQSSTTGSELITIGGVVKYDGKKDPAVVYGPVYASASTGSSPNGGFDPIPLPVTLTHFMAKARNGAVVLAWQTAMEVDADHFEIERSTDGAHWQLLTTLPVKGFAATYSYTDNSHLPVTSFYRLKMVDIDETFSYSPVVKVAPLARVSLQLSPNPATHYLDVVLSQTTSQPLQLQLLTANGQLIRQATATSVTRFALTGLTPGQYYLVVKEGSQVLATQAFVVK